MPLDLDYIRKEWGYSRKRRTKCLARREVYQHDWYEQLRDEVLKQFLPQNADKLLSRADTSMNILRWATDTIAAIYSRPVHRMIGDTLLAPMAEVDLALDLACKLTFYQGESLVRPFWAGDRLLLDVVPADRFLAVPDQLDRLKLKAVVISDTNSRGDVIGFTVWTREEHYELNRDWTIRTPNEERANPYGVIPYICSHAQYPSATFWHWHEAEGLHQATLQLGVAMTDWHHLRHLQSFKQLAIRTEGADRSKTAKLASDPSSTLLLSGPTASAQVLDMQANLTAYLDALLTKVESILQLYGIKPEVARGTEQAQSGYALKLKLYGLQEQWEQQRQLWRLWEREMWRVAAVTVPLEGGPAIPDGSLQITYPELGPGRDPTELSNLATQQYSAGMVSRSEALRMTDRSEQQIEQIEMEILEESAAQPSFEIPLDFEGGV